MKKSINDLEDIGINARVLDNGDINLRFMKSLRDIALSMSVKLPVSITFKASMYNYFDKLCYIMHSLRISDINSPFKYDVNKFKREAMPYSIQMVNCIKREIIRLIKEKSITIN
jgi:hypothetical protein